jgi:hypothetical protein
MKKYFLLILLLKVSFSFSQSKKEQIDILKNNVDSLKAVIDNDRNLSSQKLIESNSIISNLEIQVSTKNTELNKLKEDHTLKDIESKNLMNELNSKREELLKLNKGNNSSANDSKILNDIIIKGYVTRFYSSLELSPELNKKNIEVGGVKFNVDKFNSCINKLSEYSKERINNLTGEYHGMCNIELLNIDSVNIENEIINVYTTIEYQAQELGMFQNQEHLIINIIQGELKLKKWLDVRLLKMELGEYDGLENFSEVDFYKFIGSLNK